MANYDDQLASRLELATAIGVEAGKLTLEYFQNDVKVERKHDNSPVTIADREAEQLLRGRISREFPDDAILGEEFGEQDGSSGYRWILDPIDGTKSFISGVPLYGTLVAVESQSQALLGVMHIPGTDECIYAARGGGAWYRRGTTDAVPARVSRCPSLANGLFTTTQIDLFDQRGARDAFDRLQDAAWMTRTWGDCYGYLLVATGRALVMVDPMMSIWDMAALQPILEEAGGTFTDWQGHATIHAQDGVATNGKVFEEVMNVTRDFPPLPSA